MKVDQSNRCNRFEAMLDGYLTDELKVADRTLFEEHLAGCASCQEKLAEEKELSRVLKTAAMKPEKDLFAAIWQDPEVARLAEERKASADAPAQKSKVLRVDLSRFVKVLTPIAAAVVLVSALTVAAPYLDLFGRGSEKNGIVENDAAIDIHGETKGGMMLYSTVKTDADQPAEADVRTSDDAVEKTDGDLAAECDPEAADVIATGDEGANGEAEKMSSSNQAQAATGQSEETTVSSSPVTELPSNEAYVGQFSPVTEATQPFAPSASGFGSSGYGSIADNEEIMELAFDRYYRLAAKVMMTSGLLQVEGFEPVEKFEDNMALIVVYEWSEALEAHLISLADAAGVNWSLETLREDGTFVLLCSHK